MNGVDEGAGDQRLKSVNTGGDRRRGQPGYLGNVLASLAFKPEQHDLRVERWKLADEQAGTGDGVVFRCGCLCIGRFGKGFNVFERDRPRFAGGTHPVFGGHVVRYAVNPCLQGTGTIKPGETAEQLAVNVLLQIAGTIRVVLHRAGEAGNRRGKLLACIAV